MGQHYDFVAKKKKHFLKPICRKKRGWMDAHAIIQFVPTDYFFWMLQQEGASLGQTQPDECWKKLSVLWHFGFKTVDSST